MNEQMFEQHTRAWLDSGPTGLPSGALETALAAIATVPQERRRPRIAGRPLGRRTLLLAATVGLLAVATGAVVVGSLLTNRSPDVTSLLSDFPEATTILDRSGGPTTVEETIDLGTLPVQPNLLVAGSCAGPGTMAVKAHDRSIEFDPAGVPPGDDPQLVSTLQVPCDGPIRKTSLNSGFMPGPANSLQLSLVAPAGVTWQVEVGELRDPPDRPTFAELVPSEGAYFIQPMGGEPSLLVAGRMAIGVQVPEGAGSIEVLVQCSGDPITVTAMDYSVNPMGEPTGNPTVVDCSDPAKITAVPFETNALSLDVAAIVDRITWLRLAPQAFGTGVSVLPEAPALPEGVADVPFAEADGNYVAIGTLGSNKQTLVPLAQSAVGPIGGGVFGVRAGEAGGGHRLELWSIEAGGPTVQVATGNESAAVYPGPTDGTHGWHYYTVLGPDFAFEWHRVALDGTRDTVIATVAAGWTVPPNGKLAIDDSVFVVDACFPAGCTRIIADGETGEVREVALDGEQTCDLIGVVDGLVIARTATDCQSGAVQAVTSQPLEGGPRRVLADGLGSGVLAQSSNGPVLVTLVSNEQESTIRVVDLAGGEPRDVLTFEETGSTRGPVDLRLPAGDWVVIGQGLGDIPTNSFVRHTPFLVNIVTGETIELVNLPHRD